MMSHPDRATIDKLLLWQTYDPARRIAAVIASMMRRAGVEQGRLTEATLQDLAGGVAIKPGFRKQISRCALDEGYLLYRFEGELPTAGTAVISLGAMAERPVIHPEALFSAREWLALTGL